LLVRGADTEGNVKAGEPNSTKVLSREARPAAPLGLESPYVADRYFTNGAALYRVVGWCHRPGEPARVEFEDCATLHLALLAREDLAMMALRPVALPASAVH
jgi:hypothetical protein